MRRIGRITWIFCAVWIVLVIGFSIYSNIADTAKATYTADSDSIAFSGYTFVCDNSSGFGAIYRLSADGDTEKLYVTHRRKYVADWKILKLASENADNQVGGAFYTIMQGSANSENYIPYRVVSFTSDLVTESMSVRFYIHSGLTVTGLSFDDGMIYITGVTKSRQDVYLYTLSEGDLISFEGISSDKKNSLSADVTELTESSKDRNPSGLLYADAEYAEGTLYARFDDQSADEYFAENTRVKELFDNRKESFFTSMKANGMSYVDIIAACLIGSVIIILLFMLFSHRRHAFYRFAIAECFIAISCILVYFVSATGNHNAAVREFIRNEIYTLSFLGNNAPSDMGSDAFFSSSEFSAFYSDMNGMVDRTDAMADILDISVVDSTSGNIIMSTAGYGGGTVGYVYGEDARTLVSSADKAGSITGSIDGEPVYFISTSMTGAPQYRLLCTAKLLGVGDYITTFNISLPVIIILVFAIASVMAITLISYEAAAMGRVGEALEKLGAGQTEVEKPEDSLGYDINRMWAAINEIEDNLSRASRDRFVTYEAYFRFAPKRIEKILGKDAITEVDIGDAKRIGGTLALVRDRNFEIKDAESLKSKNRLFSLVEKHGNSTGGIFVSAESNISMMKILFMSDVRESIRFGTDLSREAAADGGVSVPTVILHYASYVYCVAGTDQQALTFLTQKDVPVLEQFTGWLGGLGIPMVVTDSVKEREEGAWDLRYIGFIVPDPLERSRRISFYEVLDAADGDERRGKKKTLSAFKDALDMFYERDFYFARNAFTDILRETPLDAVAKWYLFECERLLNEEASPDFLGELHID